MKTWAKSYKIGKRRLWFDSTHRRRNDAESRKQYLKEKGAKMARIKTSNVEKLEITLSAIGDSSGKYAVYSTFRPY